MTCWRWEDGRQGGGYRKMKLAGGRTWDCYLIDYPPGVGAPMHRDPAPRGRKHHRLNVVLRGALDAFYVAVVGTGGSLRRYDTFRKVRAPESRRCFSLLGGRVVLFRPDQVPHGVDPGPRRTMLSVGWVTPA